MRKVCVVKIILMAFVFSAFLGATEEIAKKTGIKCVQCHLDPSGGGELTVKGKEYFEERTSSDKQEKGAFSLRKGFFGSILFFVGFLHVLTAFFWFGTILYVHIVLKPSYAVGGLPKGEVLLGLVSMAVLAVTGILLSIHRISAWSMLVKTRFGILLAIKVFLFLIMVCSALYVVFVIGPKLKRKKGGENHESQKELTFEELASHDGIDGRSALIAYKGKIYDVTENPFWEGGTHFQKHRAGTDLTEYLKQAPHDEEKVLSLTQRGKLNREIRKKRHSASVKTFYFIAYMNLCLVFMILMILALWRWW